MAASSIRCSNTLVFMLLWLTLALAGCDDAANPEVRVADESDVPSDSRGDGNEQPTAQPRTFTIEPGANATEDAVAAFIQAAPGDRIVFACGFFEFTTGLVMQNTEGVTISGCGRDETVLSFEESDTAEGFLISNVEGVTVTDLTVVDTPGDGIKIKSSDKITYRNVRTMWSSTDNAVTADNYRTAIHYECPTDPNADFPYEPDSGNGRYGIYPVQTTNVLLDNVESLGASDAGIYVGQSDDIIIRNSRALYNVAGYEFENTQRAEMHDNVGECNAVGFIIYDLPFLTQYGAQARMHDNIARNNNFPNFAAGGIVSRVPSGSGLITLAYDQVEVDHNTFEDHKTAAIVITSYELVGDDGDRRQDIYTEALSIHDNRFVNSGYNPPPPDPDVLTGGDIASALPTLIRVKNAGFGADILWDGLYDEPNDCPKPPVATDDRGKPQYEGTEVSPERCGDDIANDDNGPNGVVDRYNRYKFDASGQRRRPSMWLCIENNTDTGSPQAPFFANFHGLQGFDTAIELLSDPSNPLDLSALFDPSARQDFLGGIGADIAGLTASRDVGPHQCRQRYGETLPAMPPVTLARYTLPTNRGGRPTPAQVAELCGRATGGAINREALARVDCPDLAAYHLFDDPTDPSQNANGNGTPYDLNTRLFSDYAVKYRFVFLPPGEAAVYRDAREGANAVYEFPVGTVITKTFSFPDTSTGRIDHVETRLLIKRVDDDGTPHWVGLPYIWSDDGAGGRVAKLSLGGGTAAVSWHYEDDNSGVLHEGRTDRYQIPHANQCVTCHANTHRPAGAAPIGPKPRNLNKPFEYVDAGTRNQIAYWIDHGMLEGAPADLGLDVNTQIARNVERLPHFNVPGDGGEAAGSNADIEQRVRGYLEVNCAHCHNPGGAASNTGLYLDTVRAVNSAYGICKTPTAAGAGSGGRPHDIQPGSAMDSIMPFRMASSDIEAKMPPIARTVVHAEAVELLRTWIDTVVDGDYDDAGCANDSILGSLR